MDDRFGEMVRAIQLNLRDAGLQPGEDVVILCSTDNYRPLVEAYLTAAIGLGVDPTLLMHTAPVPGTGVSDVTVETASQADVVIDLSYKSWADHQSYARFRRQLASHGGRQVRG